jgi:hypothetical protein
VAATATRAVRLGHAVAAKRPAHSVAAKSVTAACVGGSGDVATTAAAKVVATISAQRAVSSQLSAGEGSTMVLRTPPGAGCLSGGGPLVDLLPARPPVPVGKWTGPAQWPHHGALLP